MTYCLANLNQGICDWPGNIDRIKRAIVSARALQNPVLVLPELAITGCDAEDIFLRDDTHQKAMRALNEVKDETEGITVIVGTVLCFEGKLYNVAAILKDKRVIAWVPKRYSDQTRRDDERWFSVWEFTRTNAKAEEAPIGAWSNGLFDVVVGSLNAQIPPVQGVTRLWLCNRPFAMGEPLKTLDKILGYTAKARLTLVHPEMFGCPNGTQIYDGSGIIARNGQIITQSQRFIINNDMIFSSELDGIVQGKYPTLSSYRSSTALLNSDEDLDFFEVELALVLGLHDYLRRAHIDRVCLALSGGRDSAMCAVLVQRLVALENPQKAPEEIREIMKSFLTCAYLPSQASSSEGTKKAALSLAEAIGATCYVIPIADIATSTRQVVEQNTGRTLSWETDDITLQNLQARTRSSIIWTLANANNALLLVTSNLSEAAVGYATMDGDSSGALAPLADLPKTFVSKWLEWAKNFHALYALDDVFAQPPSAELRPLEADQTDEADLMPYPVLDTFIQNYVVRRLSAEDTLNNAMHLVNRYYAGNAEELKQALKKFIKMSARAQWKRNRSANGFKVMTYSLDAKSGLRWPTVQG